MASARRYLLAKIGIIAALVISLALPAVLPARAVADDISNDVVTSLTADRTSFNTWHVSTFTLEFSEDDSDGNLSHNIQSGDTITVSWPTKSNPTDEGFYLVGYSDEIDLTFTPKDSSTAVTIGQAVITRDGATITFNSNVDDYQHVTGSAWFTAQTYNDSNPSGGTTDTMEVTSGNNTVILEVTQPSGSGTGTGSGDHIIGKNVRYYKTDPSLDTAEWGISLNSHYATNLTGDVTVTDTLSEKLNAPEFVVAYAHYKDEADKVHTWRYTSQDAFESAMDASFTYNSTNRTLTIKVPASSLTNFLIDGSERPILLEVYFNTAWNSNAQAGDVIENTANANYYTSDNPSEPQSDHATTRIAVPNSGAEVGGAPEGTLQITKVVDGTTVPIEGVTFRVYQLTGAGGTHVSGWYENTDGTTSDYAEITTDANGLAKISDLEDGYYEIEEVAGPDWVVLTTQKVQVQLTETAGVARTIPNSIVTGDIDATKAWLTADGSSDTGTHPTIYFKLYRAVSGGDPVAVEGAELKELANGTTSVTWEGMPLYDNAGNKYTYSVKEVDADGNDYVPDSYSKQESGLTVTNTHQTTSVSVSKVWNDNGDQDGLRPDSVQVQLYAGGEAYGNPIVLSADNGWGYTWAGLDKYSGGEAVEYTVEETNVPDGYTSTVTGDVSSGFTITNTHTPETTSVSVSKKWVGPAAGSVTVHLLANGEDTGKTLELSEGNGWSGSFDGLDKYSGGNEVAYTVSEEAIENYSSAVTGSASEGYTITNTNTETGDITATKAWLASDGTADAGIHPTIYFKLYRAISGGDPVAVEGAELKELADGTTSVTWEGMPLYDNAGNAYTYSVKEVDADGNDYVPDGYSKSEDGLTVTNTRTPSETTPKSDTPNQTQPTTSPESEVASELLSVKKPAADVASEEKQSDESAETPETSETPETGDATSSQIVVILALAVVALGIVIVTRRKLGKQ
ncbi:MAG: Cna B-type domain-containing protein [Coriobacteriales bacterium]|jgi:hypothetical protein